MLIRLNPNPPAEFWGVGGQLNSFLLLSNNFPNLSLDIVKQRKVSRWSTYPAQWSTLHCRWVLYRLWLRSWCSVQWPHSPKHPGEVSLDFKDSKVVFHSFSTVELAFFYLAVCGFHGNDILLLFSMHTSRKRKSIYKLCPHVWWWSALLRQSSCFHTVGGKSLGGLGTEVLTHGPLQLVFSWWINKPVNFSLISCYSSHCCRVQHDKGHVLSKSGKKENCLWDFLL